MAPSFYAAAHEVLHYPSLEEASLTCGNRSRLSFTLIVDYSIKLNLYIVNKMGRILSLSTRLDIFENELFVHVPNSGLKSRQCRPQRSKHSHFTTFSRFLARSREYGMASLSIETPQQLVNGGGRAPGTALPSSSREDHPDLLKGYDRNCVKKTHF